MAEMAMNQIPDPQSRRIRRPARDASFEEHVAWARAEPVVGFDFTPIKDRCIEQTPPWDYPELARELVAAAHDAAAGPAANALAAKARHLNNEPAVVGPILDLGTGGGELLATLAPFPEGSAATEGWMPNVPVARRTLRPLGVDVRVVSTDEARLPFFSERFAAVLNCHDAFDPDEVFRVLRPGGVFLTQQVDSRDGIRLNAALGEPLPWDPDEVTLGGCAEVLDDAGFVVDDAREFAGTRTFSDLSSVLWYLKIVAWQVPALAELSPEAVAKYEAPLRALHLHFVAGHEFVDEAPRFLVRAHRPR